VSCGEGDARTGRCHRRRQRLVRAGPGARKFRHNFESKALPQTESLALFQRGANHTHIRATLWHAHVLDDEVVDALEGVSECRIRPELD